MSDLVWRRIGAILSEIEQLDAESGGQFRQIEDGEALAIVSRLEQKLNKELADAPTSQS